MHKSTLTVGLVSAAMMLAATPATQARELIRIATMPPGAEVTGIAVNNLGELFFNAQHPGKKGVLAGDAPSALIGYVDGLDIRSFSGPSLAVPAEHTTGKVHVAAGEFVILGKAGDKLGSGQVLGGVYDTKGNLMFVSNDVDYNALIPLSAGSAYLYTAFEGGVRKGVAAISRLKLNRVKGKWQADLAEFEMLDLSSIEGGWVLCYGTVTPWGTPVFSEEYYFYNTSLWNHPDNHDDDERQIFAKGNDNVYHQPKMMNTYLGRPSNPYRYGYNIEMDHAASKERASLVRHYAMGRLSHENVVVMPDGRTVYQSDDDSAKYTNAKYNTNSGGVLFKFVADYKGDLSSGTLYAAKVTQDATADPSKAGFKVDWLKLAHGSNGQIEKWIAEYDGIGPDKYIVGGTNYISDADVNNWAEGKLGKDLNGDGKVGSYPDDRPAFLESRKSAAAMGATNEWNKLEGVATTPGMFYMAISEITETMDKQWGNVGWASGKKDKEKQGHIALDHESCGAVYGAKLDEAYDISYLQPIVVGKSVGKACEPDNIALPDNILGLANGSLLIGEDAGAKKHAADMLWLYR